MAKRHKGLKVVGGTKGHHKGRKRHGGKRHKKHMKK